MSMPFITLNDESLSAALLQELDVHQELNSHWTARIVLRDAPDRRPQVEGFAGKPLKISTFDLFGVENILFQGFVHRMRLIFEISGAWGAELTAISSTWKMAQAERVNYFYQQTAQAAAQQTGGASGISVSGSIPSSGTRSFVQWNETDFNFVTRLADDGEAWLRPAVDGSGGLEVQTAFAKGCNLNWRAGEYNLLEWSIQGQVQPVSAQGAHYDYQAMRSQDLGAVTGSVPMYADAAAAMVSAAQGASGALPAVWVDRHRSATLADYSARLAREARRGAANAVLCKGVSRDPQVRAGDAVTITGLGEVDATYGVIAADHRWTTKGYENTFTATPAQHWSPQVRPQRPDMDGVYPARVVSNHDPHNQGRIRVHYYWQEASETTWVRLLSAHAGPGRGMLMYPEQGDEVMIAFEEGDAERPYVIGSAWNGVHQPPAAGFHQPSEVNGSEFARNNIKRLVTKSGHRITIVDTPGKETISLDTPTSNRLMLTESHGDTENRAAIVLDTAGDMILAAPQGRIHQQAMIRSADLGK